MSDAALARAQAQVVAQMMTNGSILNFDYTTSHNYINTNNGFYTSEGFSNDFGNVNYDWFLNNGGSANQFWAQNIANLFYDPRPPVFVMTNGNLAQPSNDFRYWVDLNRNGMFESNGLVSNLDINGNLDGTVSNYNGEPEWIGILKYPETNHSANNPFIGRYAFMVLPIGKTLDWNFIHNYSRLPGNTISGGASDEFIRDEGVGSWELNLAALLSGINTNMYPATGGNAYSYNTLNFAGPNTGLCFDDAVQFIRYRYASNRYSPSYPQRIAYTLNLPNNFLNLVDAYSTSPSLVFPFDYNQYSPPASIPSSQSWPGSLNTNMYYDVQDLFDTTKTGAANAAGMTPSWTFSNRFASVMTNLDSYDRYTMQRLLACIGTGSAPEYGVYVHDNYGNLVLTNKINVNFDNTAQIRAGPWAPMPTNLTRWNALTFFTNAADLLLRSQAFVYTNWQTNILGQFVYSTNYCGITNIPVCVIMTNKGVVTVSYLYNEQVHRMLQLAANIYDAINNTNLATVNAIAAPIYHPSVFRPELQWVTYTGASGSTNILTIIGYQQVSNSTPVFSTIVGSGFKDMTISSPPYTNGITTNDYVWGVPWVVGANKGLPAFNGYNYTSRIYYNRELLFIRGTNSDGVTPDTNHPPIWTNQFYTMCISNSIGMDAWNPYTNDFKGVSGLTVFATNYVTVTLTNNYNWGSTFTNSNYYWNGTPFTWPGWHNMAATPNKTEFRTFLTTNFTSTPLGYFSDNLKQYFLLPDAPFYTNGFQPQDLNQTGWPVHNWTLNITNRLCYALFDGTAQSGTLLDFVNLGPFGTSVSITNLAEHSSNGSNDFNGSGANDSQASPKCIGIANQIAASVVGNTLFLAALQGQNPSSTSDGTFTTPATSGQVRLLPYYVTDDEHAYMACDPLVHYTVGDLTYPGVTGNQDASEDGTWLAYAIPTNIAIVQTRYSQGQDNVNIFVGDQGLSDPKGQKSAANYWQFPTNLLPGIGWLGRIHRGTPWQTVYLKADDPTGQSYTYWSTKWVNSPYTYPTNDWAIMDLFTAVPNDNAARGLLSVNQTNDAAWAAVFAGVVVPTNTTQAGVIAPADVAVLMDGPNGINVQARTNYAGGVFPHIGSILAASALTVNSPFVTGGGAGLSDEIVERIPQQTLSLLKVGLPQFVIYSWGQSLRPKNVYSGGPSTLTGICTNYEVTGEFLTRTVCHVTSTGTSTNGTAAAPRVIVDSYNIMPGN